MPDPIKIFWKRLATSQLLSASQIETQQRNLQTSEDGKSAADPKAIAKFLIRSEILTPFQAKVLLKGLKLPLVWDEYHLLEPIEDSPFAHYYAATHVPTGHRLALRLIPANDWPVGIEPLQVRRNIEAFRDVAQGNVLRTYELIQTDKWFGFAMDRASGQRLSERLQNNQRLSGPEAASCVFQIAQALSQWHAQQLVHGDVQPQSILVNHDGLAQLWRNPFYSQVAFYQASGSSLADLQDRAPYLAPELSVLHKDFGPLTDIYALGSTFFELLAGRPVFTGHSLMEVMKLHAEARIDSLSRLGVEPAIEQIVTYMMAKRPELRYQTVEAVADQIANFAGTELAVAPPPPRPATQTDFEKWLANKPRLMAVPTAGSGTNPQPAAVIVGQEATVSSHNSPARIVQARQRAKKRQRIMMLAGFGVLLVAGLIGGVGYLIYGKPRQPEIVDGLETGESTDSDENQADTVPVNYDPTAATPQVVVADDGETLWESPTQGTPLVLRQLPNAPRLLLTLRPADLLSQPDGPLMLNALGPSFQAGLENWQSLVGIALDQVAELTVTLHDAPGTGGPYRPCYRIELAQPLPLAGLAEHWEQTPGAGPLDNGVVVADAWQFWACDLAADDISAVQAFVVSAPDLVQQAMARGDAAPTMQPDLRILTQTADRDRHFNMLFLSSNLTNPASRQWFAGSWQPLWQPLQPVLLGGMQAGCFSFHVDGDLYVELSIKGQISQTPEQMASYLESTLPNWQSQVEQGMASLPANPYWERVRLRYVNWVREGVALARFGVEQRLARVNAWLPGPAAHNLLAGTELALSTLAGPATAGEPETPAENNPENMQELLARTFDFGVSSNDMINVMADLQVSVQEKFKTLPFDFEIRLMGNDLREEGITQNQRISNFSMTEKSLSEILTGLVVTANPDKASMSPADDKQKLLWVAVPDPDDAARTIIMITTRKAAVRNSYPLPQVFGGDAP